MWKLVHANTKEEILRVCDRFKPGIDSEQDFVPAEYFFDHNYTSFAEILDAYRSGHLHLQVSKKNNSIIITRERLRRATGESHATNRVSILYICRVLGNLS